MFGPGVRSHVPELASGLGGRACLVTGSDPSRAKWLADALAQGGLSPLTVSVAHEPDTATVARAAARAREGGLRRGGELRLAAASWTRARPWPRSCPTRATCWTTWRWWARGLPLARRPAPHIAMPTTAGTGSEEPRPTRVLASPEHGVKVSLRSPWMLPTVAVVDPDLTVSLPPAVTAATGMDALTQLIEALTSVAATPMTDGLCREGLARAGRSLRRACAHGQDLEARQDMSLAALLSGLALANAKLGAAHGLAAPLGGKLGRAPRRGVCAALIPHVMEANVRRLRRATAWPSPWPATPRRRGCSRATRRPSPSTARPGCWSCVRDLAIPGLGKYGLGHKDLGRCGRPGRARRQHEGQSRGPDPGRTRGHPAPGPVARAGTAWLMIPHG